MSALTQRSVPTSTRVSHENTGSATAGDGGGGAISSEQVFAKSNRGDEVLSIHVSQPFGDGKARRNCVGTGMPDCDGVVIIEAVRHSTIGEGGHLGGHPTAKAQDCAFLFPSPLLDQLD